MTPVPLLGALALLAGPASSAAEPPVQASVWLNSGGVLLTAAGGGRTIDIPLGVTIPLQNGPTLSFELTYFQWSCVGNIACSVRFERGAFASAGFHFDTGGKGPLQGFFLEPKLQLSGFTRTYNSGSSVFDGLTLGAELGLDLGYQWRVGSFYLALVVGASGGVATHYPSGLYGLLVEWNGSSVPGSQQAPQTPAYIFGVNANVLRLGLTF
ncbi:MAG TPA: hypothetical protein VIG99_28235 [Myxococcaceae bacterium]|jgi:hypothetical protein